jgi:hypothetical protein
LIHAKTRRREVGVLVHDPLQTFPECGLAKVHQEAQRLVCQPQVGEELFSVDRQRPIHGFDLNDHTFFDNQIGTERIHKNQTIEFKGDGPLSFDREAEPEKTPLQYRLVDRFKQTGSQVSMQLESAVHCQSRNFLNVTQSVVHRSAPFAPSRLRVNQIA